MISEQHIFMQKFHFLFAAREKACDSTKRATVALREEENYVVRVTDGFKVSYIYHLKHL